jgi:hypothetical protein
MGTFRVHACKLDFSDLVGRSSKSDNVLSESILKIIVYASSEGFHLMCEDTRGNDKADTRGKKIDLLKALWEQCNDTDVISIVVPGGE